MKDYIIVICWLLWTCPLLGVAQGYTISNADVKEINDPINVKFLGVEQAATAILDETYEPYFSNMQMREIHVTTGILPPTNNLEEARNFARSKFSSAVDSFTILEKEAILYVTSFIKKLLLANDLKIIANHPWKFIKIEDWLCGGFAHTRGDYIILSQRHLAHLTSDWSTTMSDQDSSSLVKKLGSLLVHEQFHSLQRKYPEKFEELYVGSWNFAKVEVENENAILMNQLINPDAPKSEWAIVHNDVYYWIRTLINPESVNPIMGKDFKDIVFVLRKGNKLFKVVKDSLNIPIERELSEFVPYVNLFPVKQGLDHPNEISAYMFSEYFLSLIEKQMPFVNVAEKSESYAKKYLNWLNIYF